MQAAIVKIKIGRVYYFSDLWSSLDYIGIGGKTLEHSEDPALKAYAYYAQGIVEKDTLKASGLFSKAVSMQRKIVKEKPNDYEANEKLSYYLNAFGRMDEALKVAEKIGNDWLIVLYSNNIGYDKVLKGKYKESLPIYYRSLDICIAKRYKTLLRNTYENLARAYRFIGDYKTSILYQSYMHYVDESLYREQFAFVASESKIKYESEKKELENKLLKDKEVIMAQNIKNEIQQKYFLGIGVVLISAIAFYIFLNRRKIKAANIMLDKQHGKILTQKEQLENLNSELQKSEENLNTAQATAHLANWEWDYINNKFIFSEQLPKIFNVTGEDLKTDFRNTVIQKIHHDDRAQYIDFFYENINYTEDEEKDYRIIKNDSIRWIKAKRIAIKNNNGNAIKFFGTVQDITEIKEEEETKIKMAEQQSFTKQLIAYEEEERKRIAGELHDSLGQDILLIKNRAQLGLQNEELDDTSREQFNEINNFASAVLNLVREIAFNLRPAHLERLGLTETIVSAVQKVSSTTRINIAHRLDNIDGLFSNEQEINIFRIIQEGINNIVKHSGTEKAEIEIYKNHQNVILNIKDNGKGFELKENIKTSVGFGLNNILNRVKILNGKLNIVSEINKGTELEIIIPLNNNG